MGNALFPPDRIIIPYDDYHGKYVGKTSAGEQFFITTPFTSDASDEKSKEFVALYIFEENGVLKRFVIDELGSRLDLVGEDLAHLLSGNLLQDNEAAQVIIERHIRILGKITNEDITVQLFSFKKDGIEFGLIPDVADEEDELEEDDVPYIILQPGNYMAFMEPWDGEYDT